MNNEKPYNIKATIFDKKGNILAIAENSYVKSHPYMAKLSEQHGEPYKIFLHAEVAAILKCKRLDKAYRMLITRTGKSGRLLLVTPCEICKTALRATNIKVIEHS